jgi:hypothetical protein
MNKKFVFWSCLFAAVMCAPDFDYMDKKWVRDPNVPVVIEVSGLGAFNLSGIGKKAKENPGAQASVLLPRSITCLSPEDLEELRKPLKQHMDTCKIMDWNSSLDGKRLADNISTSVTACLLVEQFLYEQRSAEREASERAEQQEEETRENVAFGALINGTTGESL